MDHVRRLPHQLRKLCRVLLHYLPPTQQPDLCHVRTRWGQELRLQRNQLLQLPPARERGLMIRRLLPIMGPALLWPVSVAWAQTPAVRTTYHVKQIASGAVYLDGGTNDGLTEGMRLTVSRLPPGEPQMKRQEIGEITVVAVASISAVCEAKDPAVAIQLGDAAELSAEDAQLLQQVRTSKSIRHTAQTVAFTEGDPIEEELRQYVPRPPSPAVNRVRGRISFEENAILDRTSGIATMQEGIVLRADMTRIGGTYWNFTGYWRGPVTHRHGGTATVTTLQDILNRTYQIGLYYSNPDSRYVAGIGRFLLPWAPSLSTIDGAYFARRVGKSFTTRSEEHTSE